MLKSLIPVTALVALAIAAVACVEEQGTPLGDTILQGQEAAQPTQQSGQGVDGLASEPPAGSGTETSGDARAVAPDEEAAPSGMEAEGAAVAPSLLNRDDLERIATADFNAADLNGDEQVTEDEFVTAMTRRSVPLNDPASSPDLTEDGARVAADEQAEMQLRNRFAAISNDGEAFTEDELSAAFEEDFDGADANGDDVLDSTEVEAFAAARSGSTTL